MTDPANTHRAPRLVDREPVSVAQCVHLVLGAATVVGWTTIPAPVADVAGTLVAVVLSVLTAGWARNKVTPMGGAGRPRRYDRGGYAASGSPVITMPTPHPGPASGAAAPSPSPRSDPPGGPGG